jgi:hypothetical protein
VKYRNPKQVILKTRLTSDKQNLMSTQIQICIANENIKQKKTDSLNHVRDVSYQFNYGILMRTIEIYRKWRPLYLQSVRSENCEKNNIHGLACCIATLYVYILKSKEKLSPKITLVDNIRHFSR